MNTRSVATALERGRVEERRDQAWGFVSRTIVRREGGGPALKCYSDILEEDM